MDHLLRPPIALKVGGSVRDIDPYAETYNSPIQQSFTYSPAYSSP